MNTGCMTLNQLAGRALRDWKDSPPAFKRACGKMLFLRSLGDSHNGESARGIAHQFLSVYTHKGTTAKKIRAELFARLNFVPSMVPVKTRTKVWYNAGDAERKKQLRSSYARAA